MVVVDASALAGLVFAEPEGAGLQQQLGTSALHAPSLIHYELANAALHRSRREPGQARRFFGGLLTALEMDVELHAVDHPAVLALAMETRLSVYDAAYLWLARHLAMPLVTLDKKLASADAHH